MGQKNALVLGGTGLVGGHCLRLLLAEPGYDSVTALLRRPIPEAPRLVQRIVDFDRLEKLEPFPVADVFCALGTTIRQAGTKEEFRKVDFQYPVKVAKWSLAAGAAQFVLVSSTGADPRARNFYLRTKGESEEAISALPFDAVHIFRPSLLVGVRSERRRGETLAAGVARGLEFLLVGRLRRFRSISAATVAEAMVASVKTGARGKQVYHFDEIMTLASHAR